MNLNLPSLEKLPNLLDVLSPNIIQTPSTQFIGSMPDPASLANELANIAANGASAAGNIGNYATASGTSATLTSLAAALYTYSAGSATTITFDYAYNIALALPQPLTVGQIFTFQIASIVASTTIATPTLSDTAVTLAGTTSLTTQQQRLYKGAVTQVNTIIGSTLTAGSTFTSLTQVGSTNAYTVALGTNAISPTVGNAFYIGTTTGTLPAGWYPVVKVSSATSFVIVAPVSASAWTCTAANLLSSSVCPSTFSPLITITGLMAWGTTTA